MSISVDKLTENDYLILEYINRFSSVSKKQIEQHFNNKIDALDYRLSALSQTSNSYPHSNRLFPAYDTRYIIEEFENPDDDYNATRKSRNIFYITQLGKSVLQDYNTKKKSDKKELWLKNAWIPIIVSFVTTNITVHLIPKLPLILKWLCDILSKTFST